MRFTEISQPHHVPIQAVIEPGRGPWVILVPAMEKPETMNVALIEFLRARSAVTGDGFASFLPEQPMRFDEVGNFAATKRLIDVVHAQHDASKFVVIAAQREGRTLNILRSPAYRNPKIAIEGMVEQTSLFESLPERVALAKRLAAVTNEIRSRAIVQHYRPS